MEVFTVKKGNPPSSLSWKGMDDYLSLTLSQIFSKVSALRAVSSTFLPFTLISASTGGSVKYLNWSDQGLFSRAYGAEPPPPLLML